MDSISKLYSALLKRKRRYDGLVKLLAKAWCPIPTPNCLLNGEKDVLITIIEFFLWDYSPAIFLLVSRFQQGSSSKDEMMENRENTVKTMFKVCSDIFHYTPILTIESFLTPSNIIYNQLEYNINLLPDLVDIAAFGGLKCQNDVEERIDLTCKKLRVLSGFITRCINLHEHWVYKSLENLSRRNSDNFENVYIKKWDLDEELGQREENIQLNLTQQLITNSFNSNSWRTHDYGKQNPEHVEHNKEHRFPDLAIHPFILLNIEHSSKTNISESNTSQFISAASASPPAPNFLPSMGSQTSMTPVHITVQNSNSTSGLSEDTHITEEITQNRNVINSMEDINAHYSPQLSNRIEINMDEKSLKSRV